MYGSAIRGISMALCTRGVLPAALECILQRQRIHDRAQHADVIGLRGIHARQRARTAAPEVAAAHDDAHVDVEVLAEVDDLASGLFERVAVETGARRPGQRLTGRLEDDALPARGSVARARRGHRAQPIST
jgi:hypothetical protein